MDMNELVRSITEEVLKQLRKDEKKDCVMVLAERDKSLSEKIHDCLADDFELIFFGEDTQNKKICRYIIPSMCCSTMADLALGRCSGPIMSEVLRLLLNGVDVEVLKFGYRDFSETAAAPLFNLYEGYRETLAGFGLKEFQPKMPDTIRFRDTLVTEKAVTNAHEQKASILMVPVTAQITPLAAEVAQDLNINIQKCL
ncbi:hypothetical protein [Desulfovibrio sp. UCD-KL4C]|uniref:hypothetical protein n=1 Tax=Desulfovibrio sp. UCD-KL4C TaxID=2578120 RepID=UPI0025B93C00|nr:hypothetical protein [Desulfovibrio sp. UCD-KL4C]